MLIRFVAIVFFCNIGRRTLHDSQKIAVLGRASLTPIPWAPSTLLVKKFARGLHPA